MPERTNEERVERADRAIEAYWGEDGPDDQGAILADLLCDLFHWAAAKDVDFQRALGLAETHYNVERDDSDDDDDDDDDEEEG